MPVLRRSRSLVSNIHRGSHIGKRGLAGLESEEAQLSCSNSAVVLSRQASHSHRRAHLLAHLLYAYEAKLFARMDHDEALIRCHLRAILAVGVSLPQVRYAVLVVAAAAPCGLPLDAEVKRSSEPPLVGGMDIRASSQQAEDAPGMPLYRGDVEGGEAVLGAAPVGVHVLAKHFVDACRSATSGSGKQLR